MDNAAPFAIRVAGYSVRRLHPEDAATLQALFERCRDYFLLVDGEAASPPPGQEVFREVPPGKDPRDKFIFGIMGVGGALAGLLEGVRDSTFVQDLAGVKRDGFALAGGIPVYPVAAALAGQREPQSFQDARHLGDGDAR